MVEPEANVHPSGVVWDDGGRRQKKKNIIPTPARPLRSSTAPFGPYQGRSGGFSGPSRESGHLSGFAGLWGKFSITSLQMTGTRP